MFHFFYGAKTQERETFTDEAEIPPAVVIETVSMDYLSSEQRYVGRVEAVQTVDVRSRLPGEIIGVHFADGSTVREGDLLFTLDPVHYEAVAQLKKAELAKAEANCRQAARYYERVKNADSRAVSLAEQDHAEGAALQSSAEVESAKASLRIAQIELRHTKITAPITGKIGKAGFTKGNYITPRDDILANITQIDPIRISFTLPDQEYIRQQKIKSAKKQTYTAVILLADGSPYPYTAKWDFESNRMDPKTGTMLTHLKVRNAEALLVPGEMVTVVLKPSAAEKTVTVPNTAVVTDEKGDFVYVVSSDHTAEQRYVRLGGHTDTSVAVEAGLKTGEMIITAGTQSVQHGAKVRPLPAGNGD
ncbi:MAG: efflux RND transporter periplasmic adaptor subunit [Synergistes sp.]|nr:efflux RND transporter periplasmic adaptor subunit [Synergistes sp.]